MSTIYQRQDVARGSFRHCWSSRPARRRAVVHCSAQSKVRTVADLPLPEGSLGLPLVGETLDLVRAGDTFGATRRARHGDVYKTNILGAPTVMVYGEEAVRAVLAAEDKLVASDWPQVTSALVGPASLNLLSGPPHAAARRALGEAFSERTVRGRLPAIAAVLQEYLERLAAGPGPAPGYAACQEMAQAMFDVAVLGGDGSPVRAARLAQLQAALAGGFTSPPLDLPFTDYGRAVAARAEFGRIVTDAIVRCREGAAGSAEQPPCALADLLVASSASSSPAASTDGGGEDGVGAGAGGGGSDAVLTIGMLVDNMAAAFFGNASTGPTAAKALQYLAGNAAGTDPWVMEALRAEQQAAVAAHGPALTAAALDAMPLAAAVARELLRITPAVPAVFRVALRDFELAGRRVPQGWRVWCHLGDSVTKYNADTFAPQRWLAQPHHAQSGQHATPSSSPTSSPAPLAGAGCPMHASPSSSPSPLSSPSSPSASPTLADEYSLPFGAGPRACLGRHLVAYTLRALVALLARRYTWRAANPGEGWRLVPAPAPKEGLMLEAFRRL